MAIFLYQLLVYNALPACDTKILGLLKLISDEVTHRFITLILEYDPTGTKYKGIYMFFARVAIHTKRCEALHQESQVFRHSFGGSRFEKAQREAVASSSRLIGSTVPTTTVEATMLRPAVPFSKWTPRAKTPSAVVAVMKTISEDDYEDEENENIILNTNIDYDGYMCSPCGDPTVIVAAVSGGRPAREKLGIACFRMTKEPSRCSQLRVQP